MPQIRPGQAHKQLEELFRPETARVIRLIEANLFILAKAELSYEQSLAVREICNRPLGIIHSRSQKKRIDRQGDGQVPSA